MRFAESDAHDRHPLEARNRRAFGVCIRDVSAVKIAAAALDNKSRRAAATGERRASDADSSCLKLEAS